MDLKCEEVKVGLFIRFNIEDECLHSGFHEVRSDDGNLYVECREGQHFLVAEDGHYYGVVETLDLAQTEIYTGDL